MRHAASRADTTQHSTGRSNKFDVHLVSAALTLDQRGDLGQELFRHTHHLARIGRVTCGTGSGGGGGAAMRNRAFSCHDGQGGGGLQQQTGTPPRRGHTRHYAQQNVRSFGVKCVAGEENRAGLREKKSLRNVNRNAGSQGRSLLRGQDMGKTQTTETGLNNGLRLAAVDDWRLVVGGWWRLAVGGWRSVVPGGCP